jgi:hypothetical protein
VPSAAATSVCTPQCRHFGAVGWRLFFKF